MPCRLGIDVGATNTDFLLFDETTGTTHVHKTRSTPDDPTIGIERGLQELLRTSGVRSTDIEELVHSAVLPLALIEQRKGATVGLLVTRGFEQVLHLARARTSTHLTGWAGLPNARPLADLSLTIGIAERMSVRGDAIEPLDEDAARQQIRVLIERGAQAITISLMHAYANPVHELRLKSIVQELNGTIPVTLSSEVSAQAGEYERTLAAVTNAYLQPAMSGYLKNLQGKLSSVQIAPQIRIAHVAGGLMSAQQATDEPVQTLRSGQAGGARGAASVAKSAGFPDALAIDIGGCSADVSLIRKGTARTTSQMPFDTGVATDSINQAAIDVRSAGHGAGAVAHSPIAGMVKVNQQGAGANPGPACYGQGGLQPTVADANVVLGRLPTSTNSLDVAAANRAIDSLAGELAIDRHRAAEGVINIANEQMANTLRAAAIEKDLDPSALALVVAGGAGPLHGGALGVLLQSEVVIIPKNAGVLSALGLLSMESSSQVAQTIARPLAKMPSDDLVQIARQLQDKALGQLGSDSEQARVSFRLDARYLGQQLEVSVPVSESQLANGVSAIVKTQLSDANKRRYGTHSDEPVELINLRAIASTQAPSSLHAAEPEGTDPARALTEQTQVYFDGAFLNTSVYDRARLSVGAHLAGPAIITQTDATTVVHPGQQVDVDQYLNLLIRADTADSQGKH